MSKIVNLRTIRKQRRRDGAREATLQGDAPSAEAARAKAEAARARERHEGHRRNGEDSGDDGS